MTAEEVRQAVTEVELAYRKAVARRAREGRVAQGLSPEVEDEAVLARIARMVQAGG